MVALALLVLSSSMHSHGQAGAWAQGDGGHRLNDMPRHQVQPVTLDNGGQDELRLGQRKTLANTLMRPAAEREIGEVRPLVGQLGRETLGVEAFWVRPELWQAVGDIRAEHDSGAGWNGVAADLVVGQGAAIEDPGRRV